MCQPNDEQAIKVLSRSLHAEIRDDKRSVQVTAYRWKFYIGGRDLLMYCLMASEEGLSTDHLVAEAPDLQTDAQ